MIRNDSSALLVPGLKIDPVAFMTRNDSSALPGTVSVPGLPIDPVAFMSWEAKDN